QAFLSRGRQVTDPLRTQLALPTQAATRALIDAIKRRDFKPAHAPNRAQPAPQRVVKPVSLPDKAPRSLPCEETAPAATPAVLAAAPTPRNTAPATPPFWRRQRLAAASLIVAFLAIGTIVALGLANAPKLWSPQTDLQRSQALV